MDDKATKRGGGTVVVMALVALLVVLPVLYVLSVGPVVWMVNDDTWKSQVVAFYEPVFSVMDHVPIVGPAMLHYYVWWGYLGVPPADPSPDAPPSAAPAPAGS